MGDYELGWEDGYEDCERGRSYRRPCGESLEYHRGYAAGWRHAMRDVDG